MNALSHPPCDLANAHAEAARATPAEPTPSLKHLAEMALPVPWDTSPQYRALAEFRAAVTPELFLELVASLAFAIRFFDQLTPADAERMRKPLDKVTGSAS